MDGIQAYKGESGPPSTLRPGGLAMAPAVNPAAVKTTSHYLKAVRRRFWVVLAIAVPLGIVLSLLVLRQPNVYMVRAELEINPPDLDPLFAALLSNDTGRPNPASHSMYLANHEVKLKSKSLAERVIRDPAIAPKVAQSGDFATDLILKSLTVTRLKNTNSFFVSLEGNDPVLTTRLLDTLLHEFQKQTADENADKYKSITDSASDNLKKLEDALKELDDRIVEALRNNHTLGPGGRSILEEKYVSLSNLMAQKTARLSEINQQMMASQTFPKLELDGMAAAREGRLAELKMEKRKYERGLERMQGQIRNFNADPAAIEWGKTLDGINDQIEELSATKTRSAGNPTELLLEQYRREIEADKEEHENILIQMRDSAPAHQGLLTLFRDREEKAKQVAKVHERLAEFETVKRSLSVDCVRIPASIVEPILPTKPNRPMFIAFGLFFSLGLGVGLVCLLEHVDQSVKVPEHVTHGLTLPLLGVVPRIRRTAITHRGGHLWTSATPDSLEADAYRNVRASLLGVADKRGPIVTLLVTSAKAGEGKSTTALNLAATCARAGERTLLLDVDLRRPSLAGVFTDPETGDAVHGLVDVLRGELPWQRTVQHTELANLDFLPTGDTRGIPIEILGTLELRQLFSALEHHYDRVILDGPAVLGLADCRVLGRIVDASLLVVRSGSHHLMTLHRAKAMLEQSHVAIAGVVFNGMADDMDHWSSYGYEPLSYSAERSRAVTDQSERLALAASH